MTKEDSAQQIKIKNALLFIAKGLNGSSVEWLLGGSCALMIMGIEIVPRDLDILVSTRDKKLVFEIFKDFVGVDDGESLCLKISGVRVEVIGLDDISSSNSVTLDGVGIPLNTLKQELFYYKWRPGKENIVKLIELKTEEDQNS